MLKRGIFYETVLWQNPFISSLTLKSKVKLNFGQSPDFSVQLKVSLSESLSERLSQKLKWPNDQQSDLLWNRDLLTEGVSK